MDDLATVVKWSNRLERLLKEHYHAQGQGLQELISSCEDRISNEAINELNYIAQVKSQAMQQEGYELADLSKFLGSCRKCEADLQPRSAKMLWRFVVLLIFAATAGSVWFYIIHWHLIVP